MGLKAGRPQFQGLFSDFYSYKGAYTIGAILNNAQNSQTITIPGVRPGDFVDAVLDISHSSCWVDAYISANDTVTVIVGNNSGSTQTPGTGNIIVHVKRPDKGWFN